MAMPVNIRKISDTVWEIPPTHREGMTVPVRMYATEPLLRDMDESVFEQATNVATLPGIVDAVFCMPDGHSGYGFPIGGVAAMDPDHDGVISPGGIGFDINCGMRMVVTDLTLDEVKPRLEDLLEGLYRAVPAGVGRKGLVRVSANEFRDVAERGARWCVENGYGWEEDLELTEEGGCIAGADASKISDRAVERGKRQIGTLGSGNHYLEVQVARPEDIHDPRIAGIYGVTKPNQVVVMFHCGSRGFGHQVASDYLRIFLSTMERKYGLPIRDRELACAPFRSPEGQDYFAAMKCGINMSFANRQVILHRIREVFARVFRRSAEDLGMHMVYDVAHNTAKLERHARDGSKRSFLVHRKGATRAFGPGMEDVPSRYQEVGQPVIIGGSMETGSWLLAGIPEGRQTFFSTAHGSGRRMSRTKARKSWRGQEIRDRMAERGVLIRSASWKGLAEEAGGAYKNIDDVVAATEEARISRRVVRLTPIANIKG